MKKQKKTYGIKGFMEYQAVIKVGKNKMKVPFSDGSVSAMGVNPATFTTDKFMVQHAIENSTEFKRGLIHLVSTIDLAEEVEIEGPHSPHLRQTRGAFSSPEDKPEEQPALTPEDKPEEQTSLPESKPAEPGTETASQASEKSGASEESGELEEKLTEVEFASNDEAKDYLEQNFGLVRSKLRNREDICKAGKANGVEIIFV